MSEYRYLVGCDADGNISPNVHVGELTVAEVNAAMKQVNGYKTKTCTGPTTISAAEAGTWALDLTGDTTLTIAGSNGQVVLIDLVTNGHSIIIEGGQTIDMDGLVPLVKSRGAWVAGGGGSIGGVITITPTAPTFTNADIESGGGTYVIPAKGGVVYKVGGVVKAAGTYPVSGEAATSITVTAESSNPDKYELTGTATWTHSYAKATASLRSAIAADAPLLALGLDGTSLVATGSATGVTFSPNAGVTYQAKTPGFGGYAAAALRGSATSVGVSSASLPATGAGGAFSAEITFSPANSTLPSSYGFLARGGGAKFMFYSGGFRFELSGTGATKDLNLPLVPGTVYHLCITYDGATVTYYLNGSSFGTTPYTGATGGDWSPYLLGAGEASGTYMNGLAFYTKALSPARVLAHAEAAGAA